MLHAKIQDHRPLGSGEEDFKGFYHIWAWQPSWSCDLDYLYTSWKCFLETLRTEFKTLSSGLINMQALFAKKEHNLDVLLYEGRARWFIDSTKPQPKTVEDAKKALENKF